MPAQRSDPRKTPDTLLKSRYFTKHVKTEPQAVNWTDRDSHEDPLDDRPQKSQDEIEPVRRVYPLTSEQRNAYRTPSGKVLSQYQWDVYDFVKTIPTSKVTTYKDVSLAIGGSPRSVGNALRNNPFSPYIPCHRVIASNHFVGGFFGEWGKDHKTGKRCNEKILVLAQEGVHFNDTGHLLLSEKSLWKPSASQKNLL